MQTRTHCFIGGTGLFANRNITAREVLDRCVSVILPDELNKGILGKYLFGHQLKDYSIMALGSCMLYNHNSDHDNVKIYHPSYPHPVPNPRTPPGTITFHAVASRDIVEGEELLINYGYHEGYWGSEEAGEDYIDATLATVDEQCTDKGALPGCASRMTEVIGGCVYSTQYINEGDLIELTRVLAVPPRFAAHPNLTAYVWMEEHSVWGKDDEWEGGAAGVEPMRELGLGLGIVLLGHGALYQPAATPQEHNVRYEWYKLDKSGSGERNQDGEQGQGWGNEWYWEDLAQQGSGMVALVAARAIEVNELLTVPLLVDAATGRRNVFNAFLPRSPGA